MKTLYIGGTGEISYSSIHAGAALGHQIALFNRGQCAEPLPPGARQIIGDLSDAASYQQLAKENWDVVCQFKAYDTNDAQRDIDTFAGKVGQFVFISSASVYSKPPNSYVLTENHPAENKFWSYSLNKSIAERAYLRAHENGKMPVTILRPSHTYRRNFPGTVASGDDIAWRLLNKKPIIVHGDGTSLWTYTHADDFARPFVKLLGNRKALGETFHLAAHMQATTWNEIYEACAAALNVEPQIVHVPTDTLVRVRPELTGNLLGDKAWPSVFNCSKIRAVVGEYTCPTTLADGLSAAAVHLKRRLQNFAPDANFHGMLDRIAAAQQAIIA